MAEYSAALGTRDLAPRETFRAGARGLRQRLKQGWEWIAVGGLLALYAALAFTASLGKGVAFDEGLQLAVGYNIWINHDFRMEGANGDLVKRWATLPYLFSRPKFVGHDDQLWRESSGYELAQRFLFELGNNAESLLAQSRAMVLVFGIATGLLVYFASREIFGRVGGFVSLTLFVFSPSMLALGAIVSTDMSITLALFGATWCIWRLLHRVTAGRLGLSLVVVSLLVLAKPTALAIFPIAALLVLVRLRRRGPLRVRAPGGRELIVEGRARAGVIFLLATLHVVVAWVAIWAHYDFRYAASPEPANAALTFFKPDSRDAVPLVFAKTLTWMQRTHFLPEGFCRGIDALLGCDDGLGSFMHGEWAVRGRPTFFPYAMWVKTPPAVIVILVFAIAAWWIQRRASQKGSEHMREARASLYAAMPHLVLVGCYLAIAMTEDINIGLRHVLPIYPSLYVLAGAIAIGWRHWAFKAAAILGVGWLAFDSFAVRPNYLAYFGAQAGGPSNGYKHLVDSSLDWGMDLPALRDWIDQHNPRGREQMFLAYFGTDRPVHYGITAQRLPGFLERRKFAPITLAPGIYAISASLFQGVYTAAFGPWTPTYEQLYRGALRKVLMFENTAANPAARARLLKEAPLEEWMNIYDIFEDMRFARLCAWLRHHAEPIDQVGHSILIWKLDYQQLESALLGPPAEAVDGPLMLRHYRQFHLTPAPAAR